MPGAWKIVAGPFDTPHPRGPSADGVAWTWEIERGGERREMTILMSRTLLAGTGHPSEDAAEARRTHGRNYVEAVLELDEPGQGSLCVDAPPGGRRPLPHRNGTFGPSRGS